MSFGSGLFVAGYSLARKKDPYWDYGHALVLAAAALPVLIPSNPFLIGVLEFRHWSNGTHSTMYQ